MDDELKACSELRGNTLQVYLCIVKNRQTMGIREIQRKLEFSSPALAVYHLEKLEKLHLVEKTANGYVLVKEVKVGVLAQVIKFGDLLLPRHVFYVALFSTLFVIYLIFGWLNNSLVFDIKDIFILLMGSTAISIMTYECIRIWKQKIV